MAKEKYTAIKCPYCGKLYFISDGYCPQCEKPYDKKVVNEKEEKEDEEYMDKMKKYREEMLNLNKYTENHTYLDSLNENNSTKNDK